MSYGPAEGLRVTLLTKRGADRHARLCYNVPNGVYLGWTPYRIIVQSGGGTLAHTAFIHLADFKRWLGPDYVLRLTGPRRRRGHRTGFSAIRSGWIRRRIGG